VIGPPVMGMRQEPMPAIRSVIMLTKPCFQPNPVGYATRWDTTLTPPPKIVFTAVVCGLYLISRSLPEIPQAHGRIRLNQSGVLGRLNGPGWTAPGRLHGLATGRRLRLCARLQSQVREDPLDHRRLQDYCDYLEQPAAVRAVLHQEHISRIHRKTPDRAAPNLPLLNARRWPGAGT